MMCPSKPMSNSPAAAVPTPSQAQRSPSRRPRDPIESFRFPYYLRLNQRRLEHLASLGLDLRDKRVLEVGAGIGDLTTFFLDRRCTVHSTDARPEHVELIGQASADYPRLSASVLDLENPPPFEGRPFDIVFCYGLLYHLANPARAIEYMADACAGLLLIESCVSYGDAEALNPVEEDRLVFSQAVTGRGCRPTRLWVMARLRERFPFVYAPRTQPAHEEFPLDWSRGPEAVDIARKGHATGNLLTRAVFVASRSALPGPLLLHELPALQTTSSPPLPIEGFQGQPLLNSTLGDRTS